MMSERSTVPAVFRSLRDQLTARPGLAGVQVATGPMGGNSARESIQFVGVEASSEEPATNRSRDERYSILGLVWVTKPGASEDVITDVRERAYDLLGEIQEALAADFHQGIVGVVDLELADMDQGETPSGGRWCQIDFRIRVHARLAGHQGAP